jgi:hypothetical protein
VDAVVPVLLLRTDAGIKIDISVAEDDLKHDGIRLVNL